MENFQKSLLTTDDRVFIEGQQVVLEQLARKTMRAGGKNCDKDTYNLDTYIRVVNMVYEVIENDYLHAIEVVLKQNFATKLQNNKTRYLAYDRNFFVLDLVHWELFLFYIKEALEGSGETPDREAYLRIMRMVYLVIKNGYLHALDEELRQHFAPIHHDLDKYFRRRFAPLENENLN